MRRITLIACGLTLAAPSPVLASAWTRTGPPGADNTTAIAATTTPPMAVFAVASGRVLSSTPRQAAWQQIATPLGVVEGVVTSPGAVYAFGPAGLARSRDGGHHWVVLGSAPGGIGAVIVDPARPQVLIAMQSLIPVAPSSAATVACVAPILASIFGVDPGLLLPRLYRSLDAGASWLALPAAPTGAQIVAVTTSPDGVLYGLARPARGPLEAVTSRDGGASWSASATGIPAGLNAALAVPLASGAAIMLPIAGTCEPASMLLRSSDHGSTWSPTTTPAAGLQGLYGLSGGGAAATAQPHGVPARLAVFVTTDGASWQHAASRSDARTPGLLASEPIVRAPGGLVAVVDTPAGRRILNHAAGRGWRDITGTIPESSAAVQTVRQPNDVIADSGAGGWWRSHNGGVTWRRTRTPVNNLGFLFSPAVAGLGFAWLDTGHNREYVAVTRNGGGAWRSDGAPRISLDAYSYLAVAHSTSDAYVTAGRVLWHWSLAASRWRIVNRRLPAAVDSLDVGAGPTPLVWFVMDGPRTGRTLWVSRDGGRQVTPVQGGLAEPGQQLLSVTADGSQPGTVYVQESVRQVIRLERSVDAGRHWTRIGPTWTSILHVDQTRPGRLWGMDALGNLAVSSDYGRDWQSLIGPPATAPPSGVDVAGSRVLVSTGGDGVWTAPLQTVLQPLRTPTIGRGWCGPARVLSTPPWPPPVAAGVCVELGRTTPLPRGVWRRLARVASGRGHRRAAATRADLTLLP